MKRTKFSEAQIAFVLKQAEDGTSVVPSEMKRLRQLQEENAKLKRLVADLSLERRCCRMSSRKSSEA